jgi:anti-sigma factor RsiW
MCPNETELIRLIAKELPADDEARLRSHVGRCPSCAEARRQLLAVWDALDADAAVTPADDLTHRILTAAGRPAPATYWPHATRVAATMLLAIGAGVAAGVLVPQRRPSVAAPPVTADQVVHGLGLDLLADDGAGLAQLIPPEPAEEGEL